MLTIRMQKGNEVSYDNTPRCYVTIKFDKEGEAVAFSIRSGDIIRRYRVDTWLRPSKDWTDAAATARQEFDRQLVGAMRVVSLS